MFHFDRGLKLTAIDWSLDFRRRQPRGFISHAHRDHMAPHELAFCTPATAALYQHRMGKRRVHELPFKSELELNGIALTTYPAGHVLGSAMLLADNGSLRLLYTGDFKLGRSETAEKAELPQADVLVMESTYGDPRYCLPPREEVIGEFLAAVKAAVAQGRTPVVQAYALGKAQEVTRLLTDAGIPVMQPREVFEISRVYEDHGCPLGDVRLYENGPVPGVAVVAPPRSQRSHGLARLGPCVSIAVTGWAHDRLAARRLGVDHAFPLSDHADYNELLQAIERVNPKHIYCTHGPIEFVERVRKLGWSALPLDEKTSPAQLQTQLRLFS